MRKRNKALLRLLEADYEVAISRSHATDAERIQVRASHAELPTRTASGPTVGSAMERLLKKTGLDAA